MMANTRNLCVFVASLLASSCFAQRYSFQSYGQEQGLSNMVVMALAQDREGFLWVGTQNGLCRYGGVRFQCYTDKDGLPSAYVMAIHQGPDGVLWIGTRAGLARREGNRFVEAKFALQQPGPPVYRIASDAAGRMAIGTLLGLFVSEPSAQPWLRTFEDYTTRFRLKIGGVLGVHFAPDNPLWFASDRKLFRVRDGKLENLDLVEDRWDDVLTDREGAVWVRGQRHLFRRAKDSTRFIEHKVPDTGTFANLYLAAQGELMVPSPQGLMIYSGGQWETVDGDRGLQDNSLCCLLQDREGTLWIGLSGGG